MSDSDIDQLVGQISELTVSINEIFEQNSETNMSLNNAQPINYQLLRLYIDTIPNYDGNPHTLGIFTDNCENLIATFFYPNNQTINNFILRAIIGKLVGRALSLIGSRTELRTWEEIKSSLNLSFGDQRNLDCLIQDLIVMRPNKNETTYNFGMRCQDARSLIISKLNTMGMPNIEKIIHLRSYDDLALKTFIRGLSGQIQMNVRLRNPDSLEKAMSLVIEEENFLYSQNRSNILNTQQSFRPLQRLPPARFNNTFQNPQKPPLQFNRPNFLTHNFQQPQIPRPNLFNPQQNPIRNFNPQPTWRPNNNFPTQKHPYFLQRPSQVVPNQRPPNFNQHFNQNFRAPSQNINRNFKPEPMDTSSSNSKVPQRPNFTHTELFTQKVNDCDQFENPFETQNNFAEAQYYENSESLLNAPNTQYSEYPVENSENSYPILGQNEYPYEGQFNNYSYPEPPNDYTLIEQNQSQNETQNPESVNFPQSTTMNNQT